MKPSRSTSEAIAARMAERRAPYLAGPVLTERLAMPRLFYMGALTVAHNLRVRSVGSNLTL